jgi:hypothetical protein
MEDPEEALTSTANGGSRDDQQTKIRSMRSIHCFSHYFSRFEGSLKAKDGGGCSSVILAIPACGLHKALFYAGTKSKESYAIIDIRYYLL